MLLEARLERIKTSQQKVDVRWDVTGRDLPAAYGVQTPSGPVKIAGMQSRSESGVAIRIPVLHTRRDRLRAIAGQSME